MLTWLFTHRIAACEQAYDDDPRDAREILAADPGALAGVDRAEIARPRGPRAVVSPACGMAAARADPTVNSALGHGAACQRVGIAGTTMPVMPTSARRSQPDPAPPPGRADARGADEGARA